ncbi:MAG: putative Methionine repressor-like [Bryobacterales bacterium]|nr:putative Methionine repressor-like [Bryobacterales bacterium]
MGQNDSRRSPKRAKTGVKQSSRAGSRPPTLAKAAAAVKSARLEARITLELRALIQRAADLDGRKVSEFVTDALQHAAQHAIAEAQVWRLSIADQELFAKALLSPPKPVPALRRAFSRHQKLVE